MIDNIVTFALLLLFATMCIMTFLFAIVAGLFVIIISFIFGSKNAKKLKEAYITTVDDMLWYAIIVLGRGIRAFCYPQLVQNTIFLIEKMFRDNDLNDDTKKALCLLWHELVKPGKDQ